MNTPNKLTVIRVILIPFFMLFYMNFGIVGRYLALAVFLIAAITDHFDGKLARKHNQITTFGKLMDPMADKLLILSALICFVSQSVPFVTPWVVVIILARELIVTGIRMLALGENTVIAASMWGKMKSVSQIVLVIAAMLREILVMHMAETAEWTDWCLCVLVIAAVALTILSGWDYVWKNRHLIQFR